MFNIITSKNLKILFIAAVGITIVLGFVLTISPPKPRDLKTPNVSAPAPEPASPEPLVEEKVSLVIDFGNEERQELEIDLEQAATVFELLEKGAASLGLELKTKEYDFGTLVEGIGEIENGQDNKYWLYYLNDEMPMVSADSQEISAGDKVEFRFEESTF